MTVVSNPAVPAGVIHQYAGLSAPGGYLLCDGTSTTRATYPSLFAALTKLRGTTTVTIASPGVFTLAAHGMSVGDVVYLTTTGALPTGLAANTQYFVAATSFAAGTFTLTATYGGTAINTSGTQSGTHTITACPYGFASSTTFYVPDMRGRVPMGAGTGTGGGISGAAAPTGGVALTARTLGAYDGDQRLHAHTHVATESAHTHSPNGQATFLTWDGGSLGVASGGGLAQATGSPGTTGATAATVTVSNNTQGGLRENVQPVVVTNFIIKW